MPSSPLDKVLKHKPRLLPPLFLRYTTLSTFEYRPTRPWCPPCPGVLTCPDGCRLSPDQHVTGNKGKGGVTQPRQVYQRPEDVRLLSLFGGRTRQLPGPTNLQEAVKFEPPDSEDEQQTAANDAGRGPSWAVIKPRPFDYRAYRCSSRQRPSRL